LIVGYFPKINDHGSKEGEDLKANTPRTVTRIYDHQSPISLVNEASQMYLQSDKYKRWLLNVHSETGVRFVRQLNLPNIAGK